MSNKQTKGVFHQRVQGVGRVDRTQQPSNQHSTSTTILYAVLTSLGPRLVQDTKATLTATDRITALDHGLGAAYDSKKQKTSKKQTDNNSTD